MTRTDRGTVTYLENLAFNDDQVLPEALRRFDVAQPIGYEPGTIRVEAAIYPVSATPTSDIVILQDVATVLDNRFFIMETTGSALNGMIIVIGYNTRTGRYGHGRYVFVPHSLHHADRLWNALEALQRFARVR